MDSFHMRTLSKKDVRNINHCLLMELIGARNLDEHENYQYFKERVYIILLL